MFASKGTRLRGLAVTTAAVALLAGACGGTTTPTTGPTTAPATVAARAAVRASPSAATGYSGPPVTIEYAIWGDPGRDQQPEGGRRGLHRRQPRHHGRRDGGRLGRVLGQAPDRPRRRRRARRVRDGRPAGPRLPEPRRAARPDPVHRGRGLRPRPAGRQRRQGLHHQGRRRVRPAARPQRGRALLQQGHVRRGRHRLPGRHLDLGQARRGRQAADQGHRRRRHDRPVGHLHRDDRHGERLVVVRVAGRGRHPHRGRHEVGARQARVRRRHPVPPGPDLEGEGRSGPGDLRRDRRCLRAEGGGDGDQRLLAGPDPRGGGHQPRHRAAARRTGRQGDLGQPDRRGRLRQARMPRRPPGCSPSTSPAPRPRRRSWPSRRRCR